MTKCPKTRKPGAWPGMIKQPTEPPSGGAKVGHASLMRPGRPLPTRSFVCEPLRRSPNVCTGGERGLLRRWRHTYLRCSSRRMKCPPASRICQAGSLMQSAAEVNNGEKIRRRKPDRSQIGNRSSFRRERLGCSVAPVDHGPLGAYRRDFFRREPALAQDVDAVLADARRVTRDSRLRAAPAAWDAGQANRTFARMLHVDEEAGGVGVLG